MITERGFEHLGLPVPERPPRACSEAAVSASRIATLRACRSSSARTAGTASSRAERTAGLSSRPKGCSKCGFGFIFELLDDYYPAPEAAFFICDQEGRVLDVGRGGFELTGLKDEQVIGRPVQEVLGLEWVDEGDGGRDRRH